MKRIISLNLAMLFVFMMFSCGETTKKNASNPTSNGDQDEINIIDLIYEVDNGQYSAEEEFHHKNLVFTDDQYYVDKTAIKKTSLKLGDKQLDMIYAETGYNPIGNRKFHKYFVDGDANKDVLINDDGTVYFIGYKYAYLDISPKATSKDVLNLLKTELNKIADLSQYTNVSIPDKSPSTNGFGVYDYMFYNTANGYIADYLRVSVDDEGAVFAVAIHDIKAEIPTVDIDDDKVDQMITLKLKDIYDTDQSEYKSYETRFDPIIVFYEDQFYVEFFIAARYIRTQDGTELPSYLNCILVPLDLISK